MLAPGRWRERIGLVLGPLLALVIGALSLSALSPEAHRLAAVVTLVVIFWLTEAIPIPMTALLAAALLIVLDIAPAHQVFTAFGDPIIFLFIGSFMLAKAMQVHQLDRRVAYALLGHPWVGRSSYRSLWALGMVAWLLAMWMGITASVAMLFPIALAVGRAASDSPTSRYITALLLMLTYAASAGALVTPVGTPPNLIGLALIQEGLGQRIGFLQWMSFGLPIAVIMFIVRYGVLIWLFPPEAQRLPQQHERMRAAYEALGPWTVGQRNSLIAFGVAITLWMVPGLLSLSLGHEHALVVMLNERLSPGVAALLAVSVLFVLPNDSRKGEPTLRWDDAVQIDWGTVLLFGGGIALGRVIVDTGLASILGSVFVDVTGQGHLGWLVAGAVGAAILLSEITSNTAAASMVIPVMISLTPPGGVTGMLPALGATLGASMGFMLPVSTPSNAIIYGSRAVRLIDMVKAGVILDVIGFFVIWAACRWLIPGVLAL